MSPTDLPRTRTVRWSPISAAPVRVTLTMPTLQHAHEVWFVVAGEDKRWARVDVVQTVCAAIESALVARGIDPDPPLS